MLAVHAGETLPLFKTKLVEAGDRRSARVSVWGLRKAYTESEIANHEIKSDCDNAFASIGEGANTRTSRTLTRCAMISIVQLRMALPRRIGCWRYHLNRLVKTEAIIASIVCRHIILYTRSTRPDSFPV